MSATNGTMLACRVVDTKPVYDPEHPTYIWLETTNVVPERVLQDLLKRAYVIPTSLVELVLFIVVSLFSIGTEYTLLCRVKSAASKRPGAFEPGAAFARFLIAPRFAYTRTRAH